MFRIAPFGTIPLAKTSVILQVSGLLKRHTHQILCASRSSVTGYESCLTSVLDSSAARNPLESGNFFKVSNCHRDCEVLAFCKPRDCKTQANWLETKSKFSDHVFRLHLSATSSDHTFRPRLPTTPFGHAFRPHLSATPSTCFSIPRDDSSRKIGGSGSICQNRMNSEHGETQVMGPLSEQVIEKMCFYRILHSYVTTPPNVTSVVQSVIVQLKFDMYDGGGCYASYPLENDCW